MMVVWMKVSKDRFRLPEAVADTAKELAAICKTTENNVRSAACKQRKGIERNAQFISVLIEE